MRRLYRITKNNPPDETDFYSHALQRKDLRGTEMDNPCTYGGVSTFTERTRAVNTARQFRQLGTFVVEIRVPDPDPKEQPIALAPPAGGEHVDVCPGFT